MVIDQVYFGVFIFFFLYQEILVLGIVLTRKNAYQQGVNLHMNMHLMAFILNCDALILSHNKVAKPALCNYGDVTWLLLHWLPGSGIFSAH